MDRAVAHYSKQLWPRCFTAAKALRSSACPRPSATSKTCSCFSAQKSTKTTSGSYLWLWSFVITVLYCSAFWGISYFYLLPTPAPVLLDLWSRVMWKTLPKLFYAIWRLFVTISILLLYLNKTLLKHYPMGPYSVVYLAIIYSQPVKVNALLSCAVPLSWRNTSKSALRSLKFIKVPRPPSRKRWRTTKRCNTVDLLHSLTPRRCKSKIRTIYKVHPSNKLLHSSFKSFMYVWRLFGANTFALRRINDPVLVFCRCPKFFFQVWFQKWFRRNRA